MGSPTMAAPPLPGDEQLGEDHSWEHRRLILASLAPRSATRPGRVSAAAAGSAPSNADAPADGQPAGRSRRAGVLRRGGRAGGRAAVAAASRLNNKIPPGRRLRAVVGAGSATVVLVAALAGVRHLTADIHPSGPAVAAPAPVASPPSQAPLIKDGVLTGVRASDKCPRDARYSDVNGAFDGDLNTAWQCTRADNKDGQLIQASFGRQVTVSQVRIDGGFDSIAPDGTDQWSKHNIVIRLEVYFPKDLQRAPLVLDTDGARDWRVATIDPPVVVSKLLLRIAETSAPPPAPATPARETTTETAKPGEENITTVAISEIQFIGHRAS
jgi:hypothetical protein